MTEQEYATALKRQAKLDGHRGKVPYSYAVTDAPTLADKIAAMLEIEPLDTTELSNLLDKSRSYVLENLRQMRKAGLIEAQGKKWRLVE